MNKKGQCLDKEERIIHEAGYQYEKPFINPIKKKKIVYDLSLIIPVYNSEKYIMKCLTSAIYQKTNYKYEIIIVNDGSTDQTLHIVQKIVEGHDNIVIYNQNNGGISKARNKGLELARGKYVGFIDNDDFISENYVHYLLKEAIGKNIDYVKCGYLSYQNKGKKIIPQIQEPAYIEKPIEANQIMSYNSYIWGGCFKRELWEDFCLPDKFWYEDMCTRFIIMRRAQSFVYIDKALYTKCEHISNASRILWKSSSIKALDQLYLPKELIDISRKLALPEDMCLLKIMLHEYGYVLWGRTKKLDFRIRIAAFYIAAETIKELLVRVIDFKEEDLDKKEMAYLKCFLKKCWIQWEILSIRKFFEIKYV